MTNNNNNNQELRLLQALNTGWKNRADYVNRVKQTEKVTIITEDGTPYETEVSFFINLESTQAIFDLVKKKANIQNEFSTSNESQSDG